MNSAIESMIDRYDPKNNAERENAVKEIIQEIALAGLSHSDSLYAFTKILCGIQIDLSGMLMIYR